MTIARIILLHPVFESATKKTIRRVHRIADYCLYDLAKAELDAAGMPKALTWDTEKQKHFRIDWEIIAGGYKPVLKVYSFEKQAV